MPSKTLHNSPTQSSEAALVTGDTASMPPIPTGLIKDAKSGVYHLRRRIPNDLIASYGGKKKEIIFSLRTSDYRTAIERHRKEEAKLTAEWDQKRDRRANHFAKNHLQIATVINDLTDVEIEKICRHFQAASLHGDEARRHEGNYTIEEITEYQTSYAEVNAVLKAAIAIGDYEVLSPILNQFLAIYRYDVQVPESDYRRLILAFARTAVKTNQNLLDRYDGKDVPSPVVSNENIGGPKLSEVIAEYTRRYEQQGKAAMLKKLRLCCRC